MTGKLIRALVDPKVMCPDANWCTLPEAAKYFNRSHDTMRKWCRDGTFVEFGYDVYQWKKKYFVNIPV